MNTYKQLGGCLTPAVAKDILLKDEKIFLVGWEKMGSKKIRIFFSVVKKIMEKNLKICEMIN